MRNVPISPVEVYPARCPAPLPYYTHTAPKAVAVEDDTETEVNTSQRCPPWVRRGRRSVWGGGRESEAGVPFHPVPHQCPKPPPSGAVFIPFPISSYPPPPVPGGTHRGYSAPGTKTAASWSLGTWAGKPWPPFLAPTESGAPAPGLSDRQVLRRLRSWGGRGSPATDTKGGSSRSLCARVQPAGWGPTGTGGRGVRRGRRGRGLPGRGVRVTLRGRGLGRAPALRRPDLAASAQAERRVGSGKWRCPHSPHSRPGARGDGKVPNCHTGAMPYPLRSLGVGTEDGEGREVWGSSDVQEPPARLTP